MALGHVKVNNNIMSYFESDSPLSVSSDTINARMSGTSSLNLLFYTENDTDAEPLKKPEYLQAISDLESFLEKEKIVGNI